MNGAPASADPSTLPLHAGFGPNALVMRVAVEQVDAVFAAVVLSVAGGAIAAALLAATLFHLGVIDLRTALAWPSAIAICAVAHSLMCVLYWRARPVGDRWPVWARWFTALSLAEGIGWAWSQVGLTAAHNTGATDLVMLVVGGVVAAAFPGFSPYLPAFFALFVPATLSVLVVSLTAPDPILRASFPMLLLWVCVMGALGVQANRSFKQLVGLRIRTADLAVDLQEQKEIAEAANKAKSTFLAAASHDLRQPVHALGLFVGALQGVAMASEGRRLVEQIEASMSAMDGLFTALLDISRLDAGAVEVHRRPFAIGPLLERICRDHDADVQQRGVALRAKRCSALVDSDPLLLERILRNFIANTVRYTERGRIVVGCRRRDAQLLVQVWDTGPGIPFDQQERVFQEYYQLGNPERDRSKGLGLGLAIVRRLADLLDCRLTLRSQSGRGSCFEVAVPLAQGIFEVIEPANDDRPDATAQGLVVVIDDEQAIRDAMATLLGGWGYDVIVASSGDEAIQQLATCLVRPDLLVSDYRLRDGENGIGVIERLRSEYNEPIPALLITGDTAPDRLSDAQASGLLLLHKPVANGRLRAAFAHLIETAESDRVAEGDRAAVR